MHQLHDHLFKLVIRMKSEARRLLLNFVDPTVVQSLNLDSLQLSPDTLVDESLAEYYTDVSYFCDTKQKKKTQILFLFEHKSYPDRAILLQVLYYKAAKYWKQISEKKKPKLVIPVIVVHGKRGFKITPLAEVFGLTDTVFLRFLPTFSHEFINVNHLQPADLDPIRATYLISMFLAFKGNGDKKQLLTNIREMLKFVKAHEDDKLEKVFMEALVTYLVTVYNLNQDDMNNMQANIPALAMPHFRDAGFNIWHEGHEEGIKKGIEEGREKGIEEGIEIGEEIESMNKNIEFVVNLLCDAPTLTDKIRADLANVDLKFVTKVRKTFTRRSIKKRKIDFRSFYDHIDGLEEKSYTGIDQLFEKLRKKIKSSKHKLTAKEKKQQ